jgi:hypothetical protein
MPNLKIKTSEKRIIEVELDERAQAKVCHAYLQRLFKINPNCYIDVETEMLMESVERHTSHSWFEEVALREATDDDKLYLSFINRLDQLEQKRDAKVEFD